METRRWFEWSFDLYNNPSTWVCSFWNTLPFLFSTWSLILYVLPPRLKVLENHRHGRHTYTFSCLRPDLQRLFKWHRHRQAQFQRAYGWEDEVGKWTHVFRRGLGICKDIFFLVLISQCLMIYSTAWPCKLAWRPSMGTLARILMSLKVHCPEPTTK